RQLGTASPDELKEVLLSSPLRDGRLDEALVQHANAVSSRHVQLDPAVRLSLSDCLRPVHGAQAVSPPWAGFSDRDVRLRYGLLLAVDRALLAALPLAYLGAGRIGGGSKWPGLSLGRLRSLLSYESKKSFLSQVINLTATVNESDDKPKIRIDRSQTPIFRQQQGQTPAGSLPCSRESIARTCFFSAYEQLKQVDTRLLLTSSRDSVSLHIHFEGQSGAAAQGFGGPYRQFLTDVCEELLSEHLPLFLRVPNAVMGGLDHTLANRDKFLPAHSSQSLLHLELYQFVGRLMGLAIRTSVFLSLDLPSFFWKQLVGQPVSPADISQIDQSFARSLPLIRASKPSDWESSNSPSSSTSLGGDGSPGLMADLSFMTMLSDGTEMELVPGGRHIQVTHDNRLEYVELVERARLTEIQAQLDSIRLGLSELVPVQVLEVFSWQELERRICGDPLIDIDILFQHTTYGRNTSEEQPHIRAFWEVLRSFDYDDRRKFLRFAWAQDRMPPAEGSWKMKIETLQSPSPDSVWPKASTCFFILQLPCYSSKQILHDRLVRAINEATIMEEDPDPELRRGGNGGGGFVLN
ncbi:MAG: hypothetical protein Q8P67_24145, partial [archaeon]|nr:hypothetical protein [archaeon]